jgi:hypothetical protein
VAGGSFQVGKFRAGNVVYAIVPTNHVEEVPRHTKITL